MEKLDLSNESNESAELFRASLGFDFIFVEEDGRTKCYCIEINGENSGITGMQDIDTKDIDATKKIISRIRGTKHAETLQKIRLGQELDEEIESGELTFGTEELKKAVRRYLAQSIQKSPLFEHAYTNPDFIENVASNKRMQAELIPAQYQPRLWSDGDTTESKYGFWMIKEIRGVGGEQIAMVTDADLAYYITNKKHKKDLLQQCIVQEFLPPKGAELAPEGMKNRPASMRLLIDFAYLKNKKIVPTFRTAYQRIAPFDRELEMSARGGIQLTREDFWVVNKSRGALSAPASAAEMQQATAVANQIIHKLAEEYASRKRVADMLSKMKIQFKIVTPNPEQTPPETK